MGFMVDKVGHENIFARIIRFSPILITTPVLPTHSFTYHIRYINSAIGSVNKQHTKKQKAALICTYLSPKWVRGEFIKLSFKCIYYSATKLIRLIYEGWNFNSGNYLFTTDTK